MEYGAIDLHTRRSQIRIVPEDGTVVLERRIDTRAGECARVFGGRARMRILLERGTESEWVAQALEQLGHEVIVADPTYTAMYGDAHPARENGPSGCRGTRRCLPPRHLSPAHRVARATQMRRQHLRTREHLIRMRTQTINAMRAILRQAGLPCAERHHPDVRAAGDEAGAGRRPRRPSSPRCWPHWSDWRR